MIVGFTGTQRGMTEAQLARLRRLFLELPVHVLHHGDCIGSDAQAHALALDDDIGVERIVIHPPLKDDKRAHCRGADEVCRPFTYLTRNRHIVRDALDGVIACPRQYVRPESLRGEGTWTTISYAQQAGRRVWLIYPDGLLTVLP